MTSAFRGLIRKTIVVSTMFATCVLSSVPGNAQQQSATGAPQDAVAAEKASLEQQLAEQQARNEALRQRIAKLEEVLATDVCTNPEAAAVLQQGAAPRAPQ